MINDIAYFCLVAALFLCVYSFFCGIFGIRSNSHNLIKSAGNAALLVSILTVLSFLGLVWAFLNNDFSISFVRNNSSTDLPLFYKITGAWGGMDGSLLFWAMIQASVMGYFYFRYRKKYRAVFPYAMVIMSVIIMFLLFLLIGWSNPFSRVFPSPDEGGGLNPLLQNPGMVFHPPMLYLGFILLSTPFCFGMGSLLAGRFDNNWIIFTRRWTLLAWLFLTLGMFIGGQWAYHELGWGGYWAWDPVENSSLMPWLAATAFLHSVVVQEKRDVLKIWNHTLIVLGFALTMLGTFITRSGLLNSVHSFAKSNIGPAFLIFIAMILFFSFGLIIYRLPLLESKKADTKLLSKENSFLLNNILFSGICFGVFYGTIFPLIAEGLFDKKLSIQAPYFNQINFPVSLLLIFLMGITPFIAWRQASMVMLRKMLLPIAGIALTTSMLTYFFITTRWEVVVLAGVIYFSFHAILLELKKTVNVRQKISRREKIPLTIKYLFKDKRRWGGMIIHIGVLVAFLGFMGNFFSSQKAITVKEGETFAIGDYTVTYTKSLQFKKLNATHQSGVFEVFKDGEMVDILTPSKAFYPTSDEPTTEVDIYRTVFEDLYISPSTFNDDGSFSITVFINPMIIFVQSSLLFFIFGTILCFSYHSPRYYQIIRASTA